MTVEREMPPQSCCTSSTVYFARLRSRFGLICSWFDGFVSIVYSAGKPCFVLRVDITEISRCSNTLAFLEQRDDPDFHLSVWFASQGRLTPLRASFSCLSASATTSSRMKRTWRRPLRMSVNLSVPAPRLYTVFSEQPIISATRLALIRVFRFVRVILLGNWT